ncbi:hypothetical protein KC678_02965 [Candidatus Dojkabacteria bacterium]|uniref:Uncharacterized protein n=1 Tax=Candidatus Dojkabacteria bacterium TaxID=2099670 RepID=A0A955I9L0_9BACT|nr:hypothetical protein [Candidatus Dojkabacteria bacterium]
MGFENKNDEEYIKLDDGTVLEVIDEVRKLKNEIEEEFRLPDGMIDLVLTAVRTTIHGLYNNLSFESYLDYIEKVLTYSTESYMQAIEDRLVSLRDKNDLLLYAEEIEYLELKKREFSVLGDFKQFIESGDFRKSQVDFVAGMSFLMLNYLLIAGMATTASISGIQKLLGEDAMKIPFIAAYAGYEAIPGLGGLQALLSTGYALIRYSIPKSINSVRHRQGIYKIPINFLKAFVNISEIGFLTMPFLVNDDLTIKKIKTMSRVLNNPNGPAQYISNSSEDIYYTKPFIPTTG